MFSWNLFWSLWCLAFAIPCWICAYVFGLRKHGKGARCSYHTVGRVTKYSAVKYSGVHLPIVEYTVEGKTYKVVGPKFLVTVKKVSMPSGNRTAKVETNLTTRDKLPKNLKVKINRNSWNGGYLSPLNELYPVGSTADVYYNPKKPKEAFVQRHEGICAWLVALIAFLAAALTAGALLILFGPEIVMQ